MRIERIRFGLYATAVANVCPAGEALRHESLCASGVCSFDQMIRALGSQSICQGELIVEAFQIAQLRQRRQLMDDDVGLACTNRAKHPLSLQPVHDDGSRTERAKPGLFVD